MIDPLGALAHRRRRCRRRDGQHDRRGRFAAHLPDPAVPGLSAARRQRVEHRRPRSGQHQRGRRLPARARRPAGEGATARGRCGARRPDRGVPPADPAAQRVRPDRAGPHPHRLRARGDPAATVGLGPRAPGAIGRRARRRWLDAGPRGLPDRHLRRLFRGRPGSHPHRAAGDPRRRRAAAPQWAQEPHRGRHQRRGGDRVHPRRPGRVGARDPARDRFDDRRSARRGRRPEALAVRPPRGDHHGRDGRGGRGCWSADLPGPDKSTFDGRAGPLHARSDASPDHARSRRARRDAVLRCPRLHGGRASIRRLPPCARPRRRRRRSMSGLRYVKAAVAAFASRSPRPARRPDGEADLDRRREIRGRAATR